MTQCVQGPVKTFTAGAALGVNIRVKLSSGKVVAAGAGEASIGTTEGVSYADGDKIAVRLWTAEGTRKVVAGAAITAGATIYGAASGKVSSTSSGTALGIAGEAAGADGDTIEMIRTA